MTWHAKPVAQPFVIYINQHRQQALKGEKPCQHLGKPQLLRSKGESL